MLGLILLIYILNLCYAKDRKWLTKIKLLVLEAIQGIHKHPTHQFEDTIVWFSEDLKSILISVITVWYNASEVFVHLPCQS